MLIGNSLCSPTSPAGAGQHLAGPIEITQFSYLTLDQDPVTPPYPEASLSGGPRVSNPAPATDESGANLTSSPGERPDSLNKNSSPERNQGATFTLAKNRAERSGLQMPM
jgi:hypothetical protein